MVNSKDIAQMAGVSIATVSRVFQSPELVTEATREKVLLISKNMNYFPNHMASSLKSSKSKTIGLLISDIKNPFYMYIAEVLAQQLKSEGYRLLISFCSEDKIQEEESIYTLLSSRIEGLLFTPTHFNPAIERILQGNNVYSLQLYRTGYQTMDSLVIDDCYGTYLATKHLLENGHRKILLIDCNVPLPTGREDGYRKAFREFSYSVDDSYIVRLSMNSDNTSAIRVLLSQDITAVIPVSSDFGLQALMALKELNKSIPNDISMIIYDHQLWADVMDITTVMHPVDEIGHKVAEIMLQNINHFSPNPSVKTMITPYLNIKKSVRNLNAPL